MITQEYLKQLFYYQDGQLIRKSTGKVVVCSETKGQRYLRVYVDGKPVTLHRLIFLHQNGYLPKTIDHILELADLVAQEARSLYHGQFARHH